MGIIIGMGLQNAYFNRNGKLYLGEQSVLLKEKLKNFFEKNSKNDVIFFTREIHSKEDPFFKSVVTHSIVGSEDINIIESLKIYPRFVVNTTRYNAFYGTPLEMELKKISSKKVVLVGVETHTNILFTAEELRNKDYDVTIYADLVLSKDEFMHSLGINLLSNVLSVSIL